MKYTEVMQMMKDAGSLSNRLSWYRRFPKDANFDEMSEIANRLERQMMLMTVRFTSDYRTVNAGWNCNICERPVLSVSPVYDRKEDHAYTCGCGEWTLEKARGEA